MKKLLLTLLAVTSTSSFAASVQSTLNVTGTLASSCVSSLSSSNINFALTPGSPMGTSSSIYGLSCTAGAIITSIVATSTNGYNLVNGSDALPYDIQATQPTAYSKPTFAPDWAIAGSGTNLLSGSLAIDDVGTQFTSTLTIGNATLNVPTSANVGSYADAVTIVASY